MSYHRIACLSTEAVDVLYRLGAADHIAGISGFTVYPPQARQEKPKISGFSSAQIERIVAVRPDLVVGFSDLQAPILAECAQHGLETHLFNHRTLDGILHMVEGLGALVGRNEAAQAEIGRLRQRMDAVRAQAQALVATLAQRPRVYFEEWNDPLISGIGWVSELITLCGGTDVFADKARAPNARDRVVTPEQVLAAAPEVIIGSWCGKKFNARELTSRPGWAALPAVQRHQVHEIKSADILAPGPVCLERGTDAMQRIIAGAARAPLTFS